MILREISRGLKRHKVRSLIVVLAIAIGMGVLSISSNMEASFEATSRRILEKYTMHDIIVYFDDLQNVSILENVSSVVGVEHVEPRIYIWGSAVREGVTYSVNIIGIPKSPKIDKISVDNEIWDHFEGNVAFVDRTVADRANVSLGEKIKAYSPYGSLEYKIIAIGDAYWSVRMGYPITITMFVPIDSLQENLNWSQKMNAFVVRCAEGYKPKVVYEKIEKVLDDLSIKYEGYYREEDTSESFSSSALIIFSIMFGPSLLIAMLILVFSLFNKIAGEYRQFGIRKAIGFTPNQVFIMIIAEALVLYVISIPLGALFSYLITFGILKVFSNVGLELVIVFDVFGYLQSALFGLIAVLFASLYPAVKARNIKALDAIRYGFEPIRFSGRGGVSRLPKIVAIAWRNISRRKKRSGVMILALFFATSFALGMAIYRDSIINAYSGTLNTSFKADAMIFFGDQLNSSDVQKAKIDGVSRVERYATLGISEDDIGIRVNGNEKDLGSIFHSLLIYFADPDAQLYRPQLVAGRWIENQNEVIVSYKFAQYLGLSVGDSLDVYSKDNKTIAFSVKIVGISQIIFNDGWLMIMSMATLGNVSAQGLLMFSAQEGYSVEKLADKIMDLLSYRRPSYVLIKETFIRTIKELVSMVNTFINGFASIVVIVAIIGVAGGFFLDIQERKWDIGLIKSIGGTTGDAIKIFAYELLFMVIIVSPIALYLGFNIGNILVGATTGSTMPMAIMPYYSIWTLLLAVLIPLLVVGLTMILVIYYSYKVKPVELLKKIL